MVDGTELVEVLLVTRKEARSLLRVEKEGEALKV